jgi:hypothetical protein
MGSYQTCTKCNGKDSKHYEDCRDCKGSDLKRKSCLLCKGTGKSPCYSCDGAGSVYIGNKP